ncbi:G protein-coupled glucose receptor regulating Gpa2-domain-containing protein [Ilyonectria destructans]|nr:G protein-coupled glucose receptor regulating Gpa2-domain-containing protein [Ilyonectria destructans]
MKVDVDQAVASVTLAGSLLSCLATTCVLISFSIYRRQLRSFRHILVLNLTVAEFINALNNSISGAIFIRVGELQPGAACVVNGLVGQLSVQAADFSILAIALVTLLTVTRMMYVPDLSTSRKIMICLAIWIIPVITSIVATAMGQMVPVGGNWCWISPDRSDLRYALTHGWRFLVIFSTIAIYIYIWIYLRRHLWSKRGHHQSSSYGLPTTKSTYCAVEGEESELRELEPTIAKDGPSQLSGSTFTATNRSDDMDRDVSAAYDKDEGDSSNVETRVQSHVLRDRASSKSQHHSPFASKDLQPTTKTAHGVPTNVPTSYNHGRDMLQTNVSEFPMRREASQVGREIKRMMLLNAYPLMYVLLWIPGLVNRLLEASGHRPSHTTNAALQVSTQFVGVANALTYGFNNHLRDRLKGMYLTPAVSKIRRTFTR